MASVVLPSRAGSQNARKGLPLLLLIVGLLIALAVLPSALNLPQTNPSTTLEYAPVPPEDDTTCRRRSATSTTSASGNSSSIDTGGARRRRGSTAASPIPGKNTSHQALRADPKGPQADRGSARAAVRAQLQLQRQRRRHLSGRHRQGNSDPVLLRRRTSSNAARAVATSFALANKYYDLDQARSNRTNPSTSAAAPRLAEVLRGPLPDVLPARRTSSCTTEAAAMTGPEPKRADAADNYNGVKPFAVVSDSLASNDAYLEAMAKRGVLNFGSFVGRENSFYTAVPQARVGLQPARCETQAAQYTDFFCKQIKPYPADVRGRRHARTSRAATASSTRTTSDAPRTAEAEGPGDEQHPAAVPDQSTGRHPDSDMAARVASAEDNDDAADLRQRRHGQVLGRRTRRAVPSPRSSGPAAWSRSSATRPTTGAITPEWLQLGDGQTDGFVSSQYQNPDGVRRPRLGRQLSDQADRHGAGAVLPRLQGRRPSHARHRHSRPRLLAVRPPAPALHRHPGGRADSSARRRSTRATTPSRRSRPTSRARRRASTTRRLHVRQGRRRDVVGRRRGAAQLVDARLLENGDQRQALSRRAVPRPGGDRPESPNDVCNGYGGSALTLLAIPRA